MKRDMIWVSVRLVDFLQKMLLLDKLNNFKWNRLNIYGETHERDKADFLIELAKVLGCNNFAFLLGGHFSLTRKARERNKAKRRSIWSKLFNAIIEVSKEVEITGRPFTWSKNQIDPLFAQLDMIVVKASWE
jgi:hypothetical protein